LDGSKVVQKFLIIHMNLMDSLNMDAKVHCHLFITFELNSVKTARFSRILVAIEACTYIDFTM